MTTKTETDVKPKAPKKEVLNPRGPREVTVLRDKKLLSLLRTRKNGFTAKELCEKLEEPYMNVYFSLQRHVKNNQAVKVKTDTRTPLWQAVR